MTLQSPLTDLKGIGPALAAKFAALGVKTLADLADYYPRSYEDYSDISAVKNLRPGRVSIKATISQTAGRYAARGLHITEAIASDETGSVRLIWFNQPYRASSLKSGQIYYVSGQYELRRQRFSISNPSVELAGDMPVNTARILATYRETKGITSRQIRQAVSKILPLIDRTRETLPVETLKAHKLMSRAQALHSLHAPSSTESLAEARRRLGFEEVFQLSLASILNRQDNDRQKSLKIPFAETLARDFTGHLPFTLTDDQRRAVWQIYLDMQKPIPMNRLVEGDVGSGKTVVAAMAALMVLAHKKQVAMMAPTELLARQHADTVHRLLKPLGRADSMVLLVGAMSSAQKSKARQSISAGRAGFLIGTHALIQEQVDMHDLALVIVDEQHRFGVKQRKALMAKAGHMPHVLSLTATPIPRSLALTLYGELDIALLAHKPAGRKPIITELVPPQEHADLYAKIDKRLEAGEQMYVVCPSITGTAEMAHNSVEAVYDKLHRHQFKHRRIGLIHGRLKSDQKQAVMSAFADGQLDILVSTTVIEVGVDVPNATTMVIVSPERFGLAQLHQLRGRVGRGDAQGYAHLLLSDAQLPGPRLRALADSSDGFKLAELDLRLRGPGAIYGTSQHGQLDLRIAQLDDMELITAARGAAQKFLEADPDLLQYDGLMKHVNLLRAVTNLN